MPYKSDNTKYPDPQNFLEYVILQIRNMFDEDYQKSKKLHEKLHRHDGVKFTQKDAIATAREARRRMKR